MLDGRVREYRTETTVCDCIEQYRQRKLSTFGNQIGVMPLKLPTITHTKTERASCAKEALTASYFEYQYCFVEFFVEHLSDLSCVFRSDLQQMLVLAVVGQAKLRAVQDAIKAGEDHTKLAFIRAGISASRLADITSVPRQTVRRKLLQLQDRGWVEQYSDGTWGIASREGKPSVRDELGEVDSRAISRVARLFADLERIIDLQRGGRS